MWTYLAPKDRMNIRQVCKIFKHEVDTSAGLAIDLDERFFEQRNIASTLPPSASKICIWGSDHTQDYLSRLLYNARLVTDVTFGGPTDITHFKKVMARCPHLSRIKVTDHAQFDTRFLIPFKLRKVKSLHLGAKEKRKSPSPSLPPTPWHMYADLLSNLSFPCLRTLQIEYTLPREKSSSSNYCSTFRVILKYLIIHKTIVDLTVRLHMAESLVPNSSESELVFIHPQEQAQLQSLALKRLVVSTEPEVQKFWEVILPSQKSLELFDFLNQGTDWLFFPKIIKNNRNSIQIVRLRRLLPDAVLQKPQARVDLGAFEFESCPNLVELFVSRFKNSTKEVCLKKKGGGDDSLPFLDRPSSKFPELIRFKALPKWLEKLHVQGFTVRTEDLFALEGAKNLKVLELQLLGYNAGRNHVTSNFPPGSDLLEHGGSGDSSGYGDQDKNKLLEEYETTTKKMPKDVSLDGFGVTPALLKGLVSRLRKLDTLFIEEFYNNHTALGKEPHLAKAVRKVNLIPGENRLKGLGYYGILVARKDPISRDGSDSTGVRRMERHQRGDLWDVRYNQYRSQYRTLMLGKKNAKLM